MSPVDDDLRRGPKWRTRTTPARRHGLAVVTAALVVLVGLVLMLLVVWLLAALGAPDVVAWSPWWLATMGVIAWAILRSTPAEVTDEDDDSWSGYSLRYVLVGEAEARPAIVRVVAAVILGAPIVWSMLVLGLLALAGVF